MTSESIYDIPQLDVICIQDLEKKKSYFDLARFFFQEEKLLCLLAMKHPVTNEIPLFPVYVMAVIQRKL